MSSQVFVLQHLRYLNLLIECLFDLRY